jgi:hypothetical protein
MRVCRDEQGEFGAAAGSPGPKGPVGNHLAMNECVPFVAVENDNNHRRINAVRGLARRMPRSSTTGRPA